MRLFLLEISLVTLALVTAACSKKSANERNFKAAVQEYLDRAPECVVASLPTDVLDWNGLHRPNSQLELLVKIGLVKRTAGMLHYHDDMAFFGDPNKQAPGLHYEISEQGKKYLPRKGQHPGFSLGNMQYFCYGTKEVVDIVRYTEPAPAALVGATASNVDFTWKLKDVAEWAKDKDVQTALYTARELAAETTPQPGEVGLVLSNDGWHVPSM
jgi:hypothetical protein